MAHPYLNSWQIDLSKKKAFILIIILFFAFMYYGYLVFLRFFADKYYSEGVYYSEEARAVPIENLVEKSIFYQNALKLLSKSLRLNHHDARPYFEYGQIVAEIAGDGDLRDSLDIKRLGIQNGGEKALYSLASSYYKEAIAREPTNAIYHQKLGHVYNKLSDSPEEAEKEFKKAILLDPQNISIHLYLSQYYLSKGKDTDFNFYLNKVVSLFNHGAGDGAGIFSAMIGDFLKRINREELIR